MGNHDAGEPEHIVQAADEPQDDAHRDRIETDEGLVVNQDLRIHDNGARQGDAPDHAAGQFVGVEEGRAAQSHRLQLGQYQLANEPFRQIRVLAQREGDILEHAQIGEQGAVLKQHAHSPAQLIQLGAPQLRKILPRHLDRAARCRHLAGDQAQQSRLAGAARSHDGGNLAARDFHIQPGKYRAAAYRVFHITNFNDWRGLIQCADYAAELSIDEL